MANGPAPDILLSHTGFLKNLARGLLRDEHAAEDVVQDAFVVAIEKPPAPGNLRAWLASVVRHLSLSRLRGSKRREAREETVARKAGLPPPEDVVERMELQRRVVAAVLSLPEPYRSVIAHRFLYEKSLKEIARETKTPVATVRTRLRRALLRLRERLDAESGNRELWAAGLIALLAQKTPAPAAVTAGAVAAATVLTAVLGLLVWWRSVAPPAPPPAIEPPPRKASPSVPVPPADIEERPAQPSTPDAPARTEPRREPKPPRERTATPLADTPRKNKPGAVVRKADPARAVDGFVAVKDGLLEPGATQADIGRRATSQRLRRALTEEFAEGLGPVRVPGFSIGRFEVTNAQWKRYLDAVHRVHVVADGKRTLLEIVREHGHADDADAYAALYGLDAAKPVPEGKRLVLYRVRLPRHWYGFAQASRLRVGREWFDPLAPAKTAFVVPKRFRRRARAADFGAYPVRSISPAAMLAFAEWAGCHLPSEYEFEHAGRLGGGRSRQHPGQGWHRRPQPSRYAWADNARCAQGPLAVDDQTVDGGPLGLRHQLGNVWELTRTFYDLHPVKFVPKLPSPDLANYALTAKGGSFGDRWQFLQLSARTPSVGNADLDLRHRNRADTLGVRLVRHRPGYDLLLHSLRRICYEPGTGQWRDLPHRYAMSRMDGVDRIEHRPSETPYVFVHGKARGIAFVPRWQIERKLLRSGDIAVVGVLRSDVPLVVGVRGEAEDGDVFKRATRKMKRHTGAWKTGRIEAGEWRVAHWHGYLALLDAGGRPVGLLLEGRQKTGRDDAARLRVEGGVCTLGFALEKATKIAPPGVDRSDLWALCEVDPAGWPGRLPGKSRGRPRYRFGTKFRLAEPLR